MKFWLVIAMALLTGCGDDNPWSDDTRLLDSLSDAERTEFCEFHADEENACDPERTDQMICENQVRSLANNGCVVVHELSECFLSAKTCDEKAQCGWDCEADCLDVPLEDCAAKPGCTIRMGQVESENQCLERVPGHCTTTFQGCNSSAEYVEAPDGTCYVFPNACRTPDDWSSKLFEGPCYYLSQLERCE